jgi:hypothetical protein
MPPVYRRVRGVPQSYGNGGLEVGPTRILSILIAGDVISAPAHTKQLPLAGLVENQEVNCLQKVSAQDATLEVTAKLAKAKALTAKIEKFSAIL